MAHIWYEGTSHRCTSGGTKVKVIYQDLSQISRSCFFFKYGRRGGILVSQTRLVLLVALIHFQVFNKSLALRVRRPIVNAFGFFTLVKVLIAAN